MYMILTSPHVPRPGSASQRTTASGFGLRSGDANRSNIWYTVLVRLWCPLYPYISPPRWSPGLGVARTAVQLFRLALATIKNTLQLYRLQQSPDTCPDSTYKVLSSTAVYSCIRETATHEHTPSLTHRKCQVSHRLPDERSTQQSCSPARPQRARL